MSSNPIPAWKVCAVRLLLVLFVAPLYVAALCRVILSSVRCFSQNLRAEFRYETNGIIYYWKVAPKCTQKEKDSAL